MNLNNINLAKLLKQAIVGLGVIGLVATSVNYNPGGVSTRVQQPLFGSHWEKSEGWYFTVPFVSKTRSFNQRGTIASSDNESIVETASLVADPQNRQFADSYEMKVEWSMRYAIPSDDTNLEAMYVALKSEDNMLGNTLMPFAQTLVADSMNQMLGGQFAQGGRNSLRTLIDDQSQNGMYQTQVKRVKAGSKSGKGSNTTTGGTSADDIEITKVVYLEDENGKKLRTPLGIAQYGLKIVPNSIAIIETVPQGRLVEYINNKQKNLAKQIEQDEAQKLLAKEAQTAKLQGERDLVTKTNALNIQKQEAIIAAQRKVEEAKLQAEKETVERQKVADLAIIDKTRQLQEAQANEGIEKANLAAAKYEAQSHEELGLAKVRVKEAELKAKQDNSTIYLAELDLQKTQTIYNNLKGVTIEMPEFYNAGGSEGGTPLNSLEVFSTIAAKQALTKETKGN